MALPDIHNFHAVDARLATAGQPTEHQLKEVADDGYACIVNLGLLDPKYCLPDEGGLAASLGVGYRHLPVAFDAPTLDDFTTFVQTMDEFAGKRVFVHCAANYRASSFMALYGELRLGWTRAEADALACTLWQPNQTWQKLLADCRTAFIDQALEQSGC